jgi:NAD(P)-dependent dehydrogenase (short-subunit alcohol dehydrogenase family)
VKVLVVGASRGIGLEFVRQYRADGAEVTATARDAAGLERLRALGAAALEVDVTDAASASGLGWQIEGAGFDVAIVNAGVVGTRRPTLEPPAEDDFDLVMRTNVLGPMRVIPQIAEALAPGARLAVLSSRMGSIGGRAATSNWLYRASKAALNSVLKDAALALGDRVHCVALHPGWVRTDMGGAGADIDVAMSVAGMRRVIASLGTDAAPGAERGTFRNFDGATIPW